MTESVVLPRFLTADIAEFAIENILDAIERGVLGSEREIPIKLRECPFCEETVTMCHIVVLVPAMKDDRANDYPSWPNYPLQAQLLYEESRHKICNIMAGPGTDNAWPHKFDDIARCKALQLWHDRNDDRTDIKPHLLFPGDTPFWGGVKRDGIVVTVSGFQPHFDKMISGMIADMCIAMAYDDWLESKDRKTDVDFLA